MFTDEVVVLMAIEEARESAKKPKSITGSHIGYLCNLLVRRGYLTANSPAEPKLTWKGWDAILKEAILFINCVDRARAKDRAQSLEWLYNKIGQNIDDLGEKSIRFYLDEESSVILSKAA